ncbi:MAG TPA: GNAT family protein [Polyangiaceae bacterium]|jgi:RimJ/RimL family protein N-acetyltransferase
MELRDTIEDDLPVFFANQQDPEAVRMAAFPSRGEEAFFAHWRGNVLGHPENRAKTIVVDGSVAGHVVSWTNEGKRLVGYWLGRTYWGRGIASEALAEFVARHETTRPLHAFVATGNAASIRVLAKCGFRPTGERETGADGVEDMLVELR